MSPAHLLSTALMSLGAMVLVLASVGAAAPRSAFVRLHYASLSAMLGAPLVLLGVIVRDPGDWFKLLLIVALLAGTSPVAGAATARAITRRGAGPETGS
jgi:monovalent cation/proton antiporter MnhG/PhaG subunit